MAGVVGFWAGGVCHTGTSKTDRHKGETKHGDINRKRQNVAGGAGRIQVGQAAGEDWEFLSLEIIDGVTGFTWSCQLASEDGSYAQVTRGDLTGHKVRCKVTSQTAGLRTLADGREVMQIRSQVRKLEDLGEVDALE